MQAVGHEGDKNVCLNALVSLMKNRPDGEIVLQFLERLFDLGEPNIVLPQRRGIFLAQIGAQ